MSEISPQILNSLCCPVSKQKIRYVDSSELQKINTSISNKNLFNKSGKKMESSLEAAFVTVDNRIYYPIIEGIPVLLEEESFELKY